MNEAIERNEAATAEAVATPEAEKNPEPKAEKVDYAQEAYECFIKNADPDTSDADPVAAIQRVFDRRASADLKDRVSAEGKTAEGAYAFLWSVARKMPHKNNGCHISPETGYAIAMHYFEDVPACAEWEPKLKKEQEAREAEERKAAAKRKGKAKVKKAAEPVADAVATSESVAAEAEAPVAVPAPEPEAKEPEVAAAEPPKKSEHPQDERDRANGQGFLFDGI